ncbi:hypothetical protein BV898_04227 [Hypsibius exemplaris]|uniref:G-protein coupled receptors family 1 profile domain-containing protein n=1 Tax=Hypsibius exemplaris TaxID=2072580 RepID=A0A1W0X382_HYPEX|nr:hypothetical protein BV898_04227 [Hypsibius exemplaris]
MNYSANALLSTNTTTNSNVTIDLFKLIWRKHENSLKVWIVFNSIICVTGTLLNLAILITLITLTKIIYSACRIQMAHLIVIDLVQCMVTIPLDFLSATTQAAHPVRMRPQQAAFSHDRMLRQLGNSFGGSQSFIALVFPTYYRQVCRNKWFNIGSIAGSWFIGFLLNTSYLTGYGGYFAMSPPWTILGLLYVSVGLKITFSRLWDRQAVGVVSVTPALGSRTGKRLDLTRMLFVAAFFYILLYLPNPVLGWFYPWLFVGSPIGRMWLRTVYCMGFLVNPIIFLTMSREYRGELMMQLRSFTTLLGRHLCPYHC